MCMLFFTVNNDAGPNEYKLVLVNNRDEFYARPTEIAHMWDTTPKIFAGKDGEPGREGGIWLGASENGKIGCLLNVLQNAGNFRTDVTGRGYLALQFLKKDFSALNYLQDIKSSGISYNLFNLVLLEMKEGRYSAVYYNNVENIICPIEVDNVHGFGNCLLSKPFNKVEMGKEAFHKIISAFKTKDDELNLVDSLFDFMQGKEKYYPDERLTLQGKGRPEEYLRELSSVWVRIPSMKYGTRTTTVILVDGSNHLTYFERSMENPSADCQDFIKSKFEIHLKDT